MLIKKWLLIFFQNINQAKIIYPEIVKSGFNKELYLNDQRVKENLNLNRSNSTEFNYNITTEEIQKNKLNLKYNEKKFLNNTPEDANLLIFYRVPKCASTTMLNLLMW